MTDDTMRAPRRGRVKREGERRWPMALGVLVFSGLYATLPSDFRMLPAFVFQPVMLGFLVVLTIGDPGRIDRDTRWLRVTTGAMIAVITIANGIAVGHLVSGIFDNAGFSDAQELLQIGASLWVANVIAFALWYWDLDGGGAAARASGRGSTGRAFVFPEMDLPEHQDDGWYAQFVDYFAMSFNTATAFSPTDVSAVKPWAKMLVVCESAVSLVIGLLVIARAINILPSG